MTTWFYKTRVGAIHGPYADSQMLKWFMDRKLPFDLDISVDPNLGFYPLDSWFPNNNTAFLPVSQNPEENKNYFMRRQREFYNAANPGQARAQHNTAIARNSTQTPAVRVPALNDSNINNLDAEEQRWFFLDRERKVQGPFTNKEMFKWFKDGYFEENLQIYDAFQPKAKWGWKKLKEYFPNVDAAFRVQNGAVQEVGAYDGGGKERFRMKNGVRVQENRFAFPQFLPSPPPHRGIKKLYPSAAK